VVQEPGKKGGGKKREEVSLSLFPPAIELRRKKKWGVKVGGGGGEYHSYTLDMKEGEGGGGGKDACVFSNLPSLTHGGKGVAS